MREQVQKPESTSRTIQSNTKASKQAPISEILQAYKDRIDGKPVQRQSVNEEELLQAKAAQQDHIRTVLQQYKERNVQRYAPEEDEELIQGKFEITNQNAVQMQKYIRGVKKSEKLDLQTYQTTLESIKEIMSRETELLKRKFSKDDYHKYKTINEWLDGFVGMSTTKYEEGKKHYYSPVGYIVEIEDEKKVIGNYSSDGNTPRMVYISETGEHINEEILNSIVINLDSTVQINSLNIIQKLDLIKEKYDAEIIRKVIIEFYKDPMKVKDPLGEGFNPSGLEFASKASKEDEDKYTESLLWVTDVEVLGAYYNDNDKSPKNGWEKSKETYRESAVEINNQLVKDNLFQINTTGILQSKFDTAKREETNEEELLQGKFESDTQTEQAPAQREEKPNNTGLPDNLKTGIENLSGYSMDDVKVHYNSDKPAQLNALAYAQGTDIHVAPGQEQHLPHEAWHVIQQKQGRVQPTMQMQGKNVNDNEEFEKEADVMGSKAIYPKPGLSKLDPHSYTAGNNVIQQVTINADVVSQKVLETYSGLHPVIKSYICATAKMDDFFNLPENNQVEFLLILQRCLPMVDSIIRQQAALRTVKLNPYDLVDMESLRMKFFLANPDFINEMLNLYRNMSATFRFPTIDGFTIITMLPSQKPVPAITPPIPVVADDSGFKIVAGADRQAPTGEQTLSGGHGTKLSAGNTQTLCLGWATAVHLQKSGNGYRIVKLITQKELADETNTLQSGGEVGEGNNKYTVYSTNAVGQTITNVFTLAVSSCSFTVLGDARNVNIVIMHTDAKPRIPLEQVLAGGVSPTIFTRMCISRVNSEQGKEDEITGLMSLETIVRNLRDDDYIKQGAAYDMPQGAHAYIGVDLQEAPRIYGQVGATQELVSGVIAFLKSKKEWIEKNTYKWMFLKKDEQEYSKQINFLLKMANETSEVLRKNLNHLLLLLLNHYVANPWTNLWDEICKYTQEEIPTEKRSQLAAKISESNGHFDQPL